MKKLPLLSLVLLSGFSGVLLADNSAFNSIAAPITSSLDNINHSVQSGTNTLANQINALSQQMQALATANVNMQNAWQNQVDPFFPTVLPSKNNGFAALQTADKQAGQFTQNQLSFEFSVFPSRLGTTTTDGTSPASVQDSLLSQITTNLPASDTLYLSDNDLANSGSSTGGKPSKTYDNYFNFASLIGPTAYTGSEQKAAEAYVAILMKSYKDLTKGLDLNAIRSKLNTIDAAKRADWFQQNVLNNPVYQNYQATVRSYVATQSVLLDNMYSLMAKRTPIANLGTQAGLPQDPNLPTGYASPKQVQNAAVTQTLNNPDWYAAMKTASPATLQREQLLLTAAMVKQLQDMQSSNERLLATLTVMTQQLTQLVSAQTLSAQARAVNQAINPDANTSANTVIDPASANPLSGG
ncbi:MAG: hypothetical protein A3J38_01580 [Gammaproteobacteria bacterium RIFCSPHIGHO2_12_FULL_45_9]|nr:MAG: hypothetical protein A3J38_01580 [Gammaproteobacteria bacterium RIFCSPHIGHO2_12_FULL_45_9]